MSLSIIHLSDIHISGHDDPILMKKDKLASACASALPSNGDVVLAITGDIAYSGKKQQYDLANELINDIAEFIEKEKNSKVHFMCVPGNHDCDFDRETTTREVLIKSVHQSKLDDDFYKNVTVVQQSYFEFAKPHGINTDMYLPRSEIEVDGSKCLFVMANTSWMSNICEMPGKIVMPTEHFEDISPENYRVVVFLFHHPINWMNPDHKTDFINYIRSKADIVLMGHEHNRDNYNKGWDNFSLYIDKGKELQNSDDDESAFSVINFDGSFQTYEIIDYCWTGKKYERMGNVHKQQYHKNIAATMNPYCPNEESINRANDIGVTINHFAAEEVLLSDIYVWPELNKCNFKNEKMRSRVIRTNVLAELNKNSLNILTGDSCAGKTALANRIFFSEKDSDCCCLIVNGRSFTASSESSIMKVVEEAFVSQYSENALEDFRQLKREKRKIIIDDFDYIKDSNNRRNQVVDFLCGYFGNVSLLLTSPLELATILTSKTVRTWDNLIYYEILPLGNAKRNELISKWYHLQNRSMTEPEISERIEQARNKVDTVLGNGAAFIPAMPITVLSVLQNVDAVRPIFKGSKYSFLYESLILGSLQVLSEDYYQSGNINTDLSILSRLAYLMLSEKKTSFTVEELEAVVEVISSTYMLRLSVNEFLNNMLKAKLFYKDHSSGEIFRFKYPYIFYYFCGRYIAANIADKDVLQLLEHMSSRLYNETYGNIVIFVCHFANNSEVIDNVLLNAYCTLDDYQPFDFNKDNPIFEDIQEVVEALVPSSVASTDDEVSENQKRELTLKDEIGIVDGSVHDGEEIIDDSLSDKDKDMAAVVSALKTIEVLGQILQNYPADIKGEDKINIVSEIHKLGMRAVRAINDMIVFIEGDLVEVAYQRAVANKKNITREDALRSTRTFVKILVSGMASSMVHQVATSLNSKLLLPAVTTSFKDDSSISSKLVLLDLKINCLNSFNYYEVKHLRDCFESENEIYAARILDSIVGYYLNHRICTRALRQKLCHLCGFQEHNVLITNQHNLLN